MPPFEISAAFPGLTAIPDSASLKSIPRAEPQTKKVVELEPFVPVEGPAAWYAADYKHLDDYIYQLTPGDIAEMDAALAQAAATGKETKDLTVSDFPLPMLGPKLVGLREDVRVGRGFALIRGVPVDRYTRQQTVTLWFGFGLHWGRLVSQNKKGHLVGHIKDIGHDPSLPQTRLYATHEAQPYHNDSADIVGLLCLTNGLEGGLSSWSSSHTVHNEIVKRRPDLAKVLAGEWYFDRKGEVPDGKLPYFMIPVFNYYKGQLSINYSDNYYHASQRHAGVPRLTPQQHEAMSLFNQLACSDELRLDYMLQPGDIQLLSNHTCLHARSKFTDAPDARRHLLRLWVCTPLDRPLPECYRELYGGSIEIGNRGGIIVPGTQLCVPLEAE